MINKINFSKFFKVANIFSLLAISTSVLFLFLKGLNYGVDFKGGTLLEIRVSDSNIKIQDIRDSLRTSDLGDISVKQFGKKEDFLITPTTGGTLTYTDAGDVKFGSTFTKWGTLNESTGAIYFDRAGVQTIPLETYNVTPVLSTPVILKVVPS